MGNSASYFVQPCRKTDPVKKGTLDSLVVNILIVEDDEHTLAALVRLVKRMGHSPKGVRTIKEAMNELRRSTPQVLITDWDLGEHSNGVDIAALALELNKDCRVVFCSGNNHALLRHQSRHLNICAYIKKPFSLIGFRGVLTGVLERESTK